MGGVEEKTALEHSRYRTAFMLSLSPFRYRRAKLKSLKVKMEEVSQSLVQIKNLNSGTKDG